MNEKKKPETTETSAAVTAPITPVPDEASLNADLWATTQISPKVEESLVGVQTITTVPVKKPRSGQWIYINPDAAWRREVYALEVGEIEKETWLVHPSLFPHLEDELSRRLLVAYAVKGGGTCLWPVKVPVEGARANGWVSSAWEVINTRSGRWIKIVSNQAVGAYDCFERTVQKAEPRWPSKGFRHLFETAFHNRFITSLDHPVIAEILGTK